MRILLLEDDPILGEGLRDFLRAEGHVVDWVTTLQQAGSLINEPHDALLVDWQVPDGSGLDWVRRLRSRQDTRPILMLTARDLLEDRIQGLSGGADDYLVKPFAPEELVARLHAVHRRSAGTPSGRKRIRHIEVDLAGRVAWDHRCGHAVMIDLTAREWQILEALISRADRIVDKSTLESLAAGMDTQTSSNVVEVHIGNLRRKLGRDFIETVRGLGYRITSAPA